MEYKPSTTYHAKHIPSGEEWVILGISPERNKVCAAGWPATIADLSDMKDFVEAGPISESELNYRNKKFGESWI